MILVFDIESIPDTDLLKSYYGYEGDELEICNIAFETQSQKSGSSFLPVAFHRIISISALICDEYGRFERLGNFGTKDIESINIKDLDSLEKLILSEFLTYMNKNNPKLVSFNGRNFDIPAILTRALKYNLSAQAYFEKNNQSLNKTKWDNYRSRYSEDFHIDLLESLGNFGSIKNINLDLYCALSGAVGKYDINGAQVHNIFFETEDKKEALNIINSYCQSDVLNTYWLYLKFELLRDNINLEQYANMLAIFKDKLPKDASYYEIFSQKLEGEIQKCQNI